MTAKPSSFRIRGVQYIQLCTRDGTCIRNMDTRIIGNQYCGVKTTNSAVIATFWCDVNIKFVVWFPSSNNIHNTLQITK